MGLTLNPESYTPAMGLTLNPKTHIHAGELPRALHPHTTAGASSDCFQALQSCQCCFCGTSHWVHQGHQKVHVRCQEVPVLRNQAGQCAADV